MRCEESKFTVWLRQIETSHFNKQITRWLNDMYDGVTYAILPGQLPYATAARNGPSAVSFSFVGKRSYPDTFVMQVREEKAWSEHIRLDLVVYDCGRGRVDIGLWASSAWLQNGSIERAWAREVISEQVLRPKPSRTHRRCQYLPPRQHKIFYELLKQQVWPQPTA